MPQLTVKDLIDPMHDRFPETRKVSNTATGWFACRVVRDHGGDKAPVRDAYPTDPARPWSPRSGQRYRVPSRYATEEGKTVLIDALTERVLAYAHRKARRTGRRS